MTAFDDLFEANRTYAQSFDQPGLTAPADQHVAIVTCMDSRIDPLALFGLGLGEAKVIRNPGGQVTPEALTSLVLATTLLDCTRIAVVQHTKCAMASADNAALRSKIADATGDDSTDFVPGAIADQAASITAGLDAIRQHPLIPDAVDLLGAIYDVDTGAVTPVV